MMDMSSRESGLFRGRDLSYSRNNCLFAISTTDPRGCYTSIPDNGITKRGGTADTLKKPSLRVRLDSNSRRTPERRKAEFD